MNWFPLICECRYGWANLHFEKNFDTLKWDCFDIYLINTYISRRISGINSSIIDTKISLACVFQKWGSDHIALAAELAFTKEWQVVWLKSFNIQVLIPNKEQEVPHSFKVCVMIFTFFLYIPVLNMELVIFWNIFYSVVQFFCQKYFIFGYGFLVLKWKKKNLTCLVLCEIAYGMNTSLVSIWHDYKKLVTDRVGILRLWILFTQFKH